MLVHTFGEGRRKLRVTIPALGCGHGRLAWGRVKAMIEHYLSDLNADIFVFAPRVQDMESPCHVKC